GLAVIRRARDEDLVEIRTRALLNARLPSGVNVVEISAGRIGDDRSLIVVEGSVTRRGALAGDRAADSVPAVAVIIRALHVDQRAAAGVVIGNPNLFSVGGDPLAVGAGGVNDLSC